MSYLSRRYVVVAGLALASCHRAGEAPSKSVLLTTSRWRESAQLHTTTFATGSPTVKDEYATMQSCERDNFIQFQADHSLVEEEGLSKCDPAAPQQQVGTWNFNADETKLQVSATPPGSAVLTYEVVELSTSTLRLHYSTVSTGSIPAVFELDTTYTAF